MSKAHKPQFASKPEGKEIIGKIVEMRRLENGRAVYSFNEIAKRFNAEGIPTAQGGKWHLKLVEYFFKRYGGKILNEQAKGQKG